MRLLLVMTLLFCSCRRPLIVDERGVENDGGALSVSLRTMVVSPSGEERPVVEGETLHSGDRVFFMVRASQPAYLYVVLFGPDGKANVLFPREPKVDETVPARCPLRIPAQGAFYLKLPAGPEDIRVVAASEPLAKLDRRLCEQLRLSCQKTDGGPARASECRAPETRQETRSIFSSVKMATASERGVASLRMSFKHDQPEP